MRTVISGFDSAWTAQKRGAIASIVVEDSHVSVLPPEPASFSEAHGRLRRHSAGADLHVIALDQPCIVPNFTGRRPVEGAVSHLIGRLGGGVQPANRSKAGMFDDAAPLWRFLEEADAQLDPFLVPGATAGRFVVEVFPALATAGLFPTVLERRALWKYNPERRNTFRSEDWMEICVSVTEAYCAIGAWDAVPYLVELAETAKPKKLHQDALDAFICALVGYVWWRFGTDRAVVVGDIETGYIVTPAHPLFSAELRKDAEDDGVPFSGGGKMATYPLLASGM